MNRCCAALLKKTEICHDTGLSRGVSFRCAAELTVDVFAPGEDVTVGAQSDRVPIAERNGRIVALRRDGGGGNANSDEQQKDAGDEEPHADILAERQD